MSRSSVFADMASQDVTAAELNKLDGVTVTTAQINAPTTLGTVTSGTLGSGVTFPAGHIITMGTLEPSGTTWVGAGSYVACNNYEISIVKKLGADSKIVLLCSYAHNMYWPGGSYNWMSDGRTRWKRSAPTSADFNEYKQYWADEAGTETHWNIYHNQTNGFVDTSSATGTHTYKMYVKANDLVNNVSLEQSFIQIMEVVE